MTLAFQPTDPTRQRQQLATPSVAMLTLLVMLSLPSSLIAQEPEIAGKITSVTVYRNQARVVREILIAASPELQHLRVPGLPVQMVRSSAYTDSDSKTRVRSIRIDSLAAKKGDESDDDDPLTVLRAAQEKLQSQIETAEHTSRVIEQDLLTLEKLVSFSADKVRQNLDRATLDVNSVTALADFTMQRRRQLAEELYKTETELRALNISLDDNELQQRELNIANNLRGYEARLAIESPAGGWVRLTYEVGGVNWTPRYTVRSQKGEGKDREFSLQLDAAVVQNSGEPWENVEVTLATSTPATRAGRPLLTPLRIEAIARDNSGGGQVERLSAIAAAGPSEWMDALGMQQDLALNTEAGLKQVDELTLAGQVQRDIATDAGMDESDENYVVSGKISMQDHPQIQTVTILNKTLTGEMHHVVTPLLSSLAFREAKLTNTSDENLVGGSADVYLDGQFAGRITLPPTAAGQRLVVGFGNDRQVRTRRELLARKESIHGGNRRSELKYRLVVSNYHDEAIDIQLLDRIPIAAKDGSINVSLDAADVTKLSADPLYGRMQRPTGVLRWDLTIPPRRFGSDAYDHEYQYVVELDRQQTIVGDNLVRRMRSDLRFEKTNGGGGFGGGIFRVAD